MSSPLTVNLKSLGGLNVHVQTDSSATVGQLKEDISLAHPEKPAAWRQRVIFAGRILQDNQTLSSVLTQHDTLTEVSFHLVLRPDPAATAAPPVSPSVAAPPPIFHQRPNPVHYYQQQPYAPQMNTPQIPPFQGQPPLQHQHQHQQHQYHQHPHQPHPQPHQQGPVPLYQQQAQQPHQHGPVPQHPQQQFQFQHQYHGHGHVHMPPPGFNQPNPPPPPGRHFNAGIVLRIDLALIAKLAVMVYVLSQGGGEDRFALLIAGAIAVYIYQQRGNPAAARPNGQPGAAQANPAAANGDVRAANGEAVADPPAPPTPQLPFWTNREGGPLVQVSAFVVPFFLSLFPGWTVPEIPAPAPPVAPVDPAVGAAPVPEVAQ